MLQYVGLQLRDSVSRFSHETADKTVVGELTESSRKYFNASAMFLNNVTPGVDQWVCCAIPCRVTVPKVSLGLGIDTM